MLLTLKEKIPLIVSEFLYSLAYFLSVFLFSSISIQCEGHTKDFWLTLSTTTTCTLFFLWFAFSMPDLLLICLLKVKKHAEMLVILSEVSESLPIRFLGLRLAHHVVNTYWEPTISQAGEPRQGEQKPHRVWRRSRWGSWWEWPLNWVLI